MAGTSCLNINKCILDISKQLTDDHIRVLHKIINQDGSCRCIECTCCPLSSSITGVTCNVVARCFIDERCNGPAERRYVRCAMKILEHYAIDTILLGEKDDVKQS